ncbi:MGMT family protein [Glaciihabitans sp. dw_435]|uniref:MGMT family protein n=1 Tax=Glaciihabitans sp. dw_435 TaxID=2720081 RepID=UPI001BD4E565|nr:MGMT family protein [Glaciihabitans sp. dw_435]
MASTPHDPGAALAPGAPSLGDDFVSRVLDVVGTIPPGRVMTYGDVAAAFGSRAARAVGQTMAYYGADVPWWRVVRSSGHPAVNHEPRALEYYRAESTPLKWSASGVFRVDLAAARFDPNGTDEPQA